tara:strand:+ start:2677 stop:3672 length:996 start_codon:yes stop_codon:yes gene_type:complete
MAVLWNKAYETSTDGDMPTSTANNWSQGFTVRSGTLEFLTLRYDITFANSPVVASDISALIDSLRIIINGEVAHDFTAGYSNNDLTVASQYGYLLNKIGGRVVEQAVLATPQTRTGFINIPLGRVLNSTGQNRIECIVGWSAAAAALSAGNGTLEWWCRYNDAAETMTTVVPATSFTHSASIEQVIVRCPTNLPAGSVVSGLLILNDSQEAQFGAQGIRINALSDYGITDEQWAMINGDLMNGVMWNNGSASPTTLAQLDYAQGLAGALFIPTFNLSLGDIATIIDSGAATTRKYLPIITTPIGGRLKQEQVQTARLQGNTSKAILSNDLQ